MNNINPQSPDLPNAEKERRDSAGDNYNVISSNTNNSKKNSTSEVETTASPNNQPPSKQELNENSISTVLNTPVQTPNPNSSTTTHKGYPKSLESEKAVLGSVLINNNLFNEVFAKLVPADFYDRRHQLIASTMLSYRMEKGEAAIDEITLTTLLGNSGKLVSAGGLAYINEIINSIPTILNFEYYVEIVKEKSLLRSIMQHCENSLASCSVSEPSETVTEKLLQNLYELSSGTYQDYLMLRNNVDETVTSISETFEGKATIAVSSGYQTIDKIIGGLQRSNLIIIGGRTGMGKTAFALSMVLRIAAGGQKLITGTASPCPVGFFSLEMSNREITTRLLASVANIEAYKFRQQNQTQLSWDAVLNGADKLRKLPIFIDDTPGITISELRLKARRMVQRDNVRLIVVDYLQLITSSEPNIMREQQISNISKQLKNLARELDIPIITLTQLNRNAEMREDKIPKLSDIRESGAIEQDADLVMFIHRPGYDQVRENSEEEDENYETNDSAKIYIAKNRHGPTGFANLSFDDRFMRFEDAPETPQEF